MDAAVMIDPNDSDRGNTMDFEKKYLEQLAETAREAARANKAESDLKDATKRGDTLAGELVGEKARADKAESARTDAMNGLDERVQSRVDLVAQAKSAGVEVVKGMTDRAVRVAVIKRVDNVDVDAKESDDFVNGLYSSAARRLDTARTNIGNARPGGAPVRTDADDDSVPPELAARAKMITEQNTHKQDA
jgi:hypothetical protein